MQKRYLLSNTRGRRTIAILLRANWQKDWDTKNSKILQASIKNSTKSISPSKKCSIDPVEPRQKNKPSNFGTFLSYTQILIPLSSQFEKWY